MLQKLSYIINVAPEGVPQVVKLSQNENGRTLEFTLTGAGVVSIPAGSTVTISGTKPDGVVYSATGTLSGNTVSFSETTQMTAVSGIWPAKIKVTYSGETIATCKVVMAIDPDPVEPGSVPSNSQLNGLVAEAQQYATYAKEEAYGSPLVAATAAAMTDKTRVYVYTGTETGKTAGHWYYWNGSAWTDGGVYNSQGINTDTTLTLSGMAADSKATGDQITGLKSDLKSAIDAIVSGEGTETPALGDYNGSAIVSSTNRGIILNELGNIETVSVKSGLQFAVAVNNSGVGSTVTYLASWGTTPYNVSSRTEKYLFVFVRKSDNSALSTSDLNNAITFTYKESLSDLHNVIYGNNINIPYGTGTTGFYSGSVGDEIVTNNTDGVYYQPIDLSAYIGKDVKISFTTTGITSTRISAICDSSGIIGAFVKEQIVYRDGFAILHIDSTYNVLYISTNATASNLSIIIIDEVGLVNNTQTTVYVSTSGNDNNDGSLYEPFATIQKAIASNAEIIKVEAGEYAGFEVSGRKTPLKIMLKDIPTTYNSANPEVEKIKIVSRPVGRDFAVLFENCSNIVIEDVYASVGDCNEFGFYNVTDAIVTRCFARGNSSAVQKDGFKFYGANAKVYSCEAWNISRDGFNISVYGNVEFYNCVAHDCGDDGVSHHDGCRGFVDGGEFYNCVKAGIATPCYGSIVSVQNAYCHNNKFGLYSWSDGILPNSYGRVTGCVFKNNTDTDITINYADIVGWNNIYDTKNVGSNGVFTEIANS